jgi:hypothetical protein
MKFQGINNCTLDSTKEYDMSVQPLGYHPRLPHVQWVDLEDNGVAVEVVVVKRDKYSGDLYFIRTDRLDPIDQNRLVKILERRDASRYELWDLLGNTTLGNGMNALEYFHQLVKVMTPSGVFLTPSSGTAGVALKVDEEAEARKASRRGPGRPPNQPQGY